MKLPEVEMNIFETILARRSVRSYSPQLVDADKLRILLEAAVRAPTAMHEEPWAFVVVQDQQLLRDLSERAKPLFIEQVKRIGHSFDVVNQPEFNIFYNAGTLIIICAKATRPFAEADCWLAAENLMLVACAMGLGTCVIGSALLALSNSEVKSLLGIPAEFEAVAPIVVGYPNGDTAASKRKKPQILNRIAVSA